MLHHVYSSSFVHSAGFEIKTRRFRDRICPCHKDREREVKKGGDSVWDSFCWFSLRQLQVIHSETSSGDSVWDSFWWFSLRKLLVIHSETAYGDSLWDSFWWFSLRQLLVIHSETASGDSFWDSFWWFTLRQLLLVTDWTAALLILFLKISGYPVSKSPLS